jgi:dihydroorotase
LKRHKYFRFATIINEGRREQKNVLVEDNRIKRISEAQITDLPSDTEIINCENLLLIPGVIDSHVHFRQPGLEYKADMSSESAAACAGGVTTVLDMPNTLPTTTTRAALEEKIRLARTSMLCNYGFFFGITNTNLEEALRLSDSGLICGYKIFFGASTGNMLVDNIQTIERLFAESPLVITAHCEDEARIRNNTKIYQDIYLSKPAPASVHPLIRDAEACYLSSSFAVAMAKRHNTRLNIAHITTKRELALLEAGNITTKSITAEVTPSHLLFTDKDYADKSNLIKCNPAIKSEEDRDALRKALKDKVIDLIATDHAPHLLEEKQKPYFGSPSGMPSIQHSLLVMLELAAQGIITQEEVVEKMCHNPALRFSIKGRGFIKEGYFADLVLVNPQKQTSVTEDNILYKCHWSPLMQTTFSHSVEQTFVNGNCVFGNGNLIRSSCGMRI